MDDFRKIDDGYKGWARKMFGSRGAAFIAGLIVGAFLGATVLYTTVQAILA